MANILILCWQLLKPNYEKAFTTLICAPKFRALHIMESYGKVLFYANRIQV